MGLKVGIKNYLLRYKISIFMYIIATLVGSLSVAFIAVVSSQAIEFLVNGIYDNSITYFIITIAIYVISCFCWFLSSVIYYKTGGKIIADLNCDLCNQAFKLSSKTYSDNSSGVFIERIVEDPKRFVSSLSGTIDALMEIMSSLIIVIYVISLNFILGLIILAILILGAIIELFRLKVYKKNTKELYDVEDNITSLTNEIVRSERDIKSLGLENSLSDIAKINYNEYRKVNIKANMHQEYFWRLKDLLMEIGSFLMFILGVVLIEKSLLAIATFMIVYTYRRDIYSLSRNFGSFSNMFIYIKICADRMFSLFNDDLFETERFGDVNVENVIGNIEFRNVSFSYKDYKIEKDKKTKKEFKVLVTETPVFNNLNFKIPHNKTIAFVGKSGSGKSTILSLLSKIYNVDSGEVLIDGNNVEDLNKETLRKTFSLVNQFPYIFDMTIKENLLMANKEASEEEINEVIKQAYLDDFIFGLKDGINTKVGENGIRLSGGQKQRFAIARALLRKSPIILLDESTSSLDNIAQKEIKKSIDGLKGKSTIVIVAHRLSTIKDVDKIFFLDKGVIIDEGTFDELYNQNEKFRNMFLAENI